MGKRSGKPPDHNERAHKDSIEDESRSGDSKLPDTTTRTLLGGSLDKDSKQNQDDIPRYTPFRSHRAPIPINLAAFGEDSTPSERSARQTSSPTLSTMSHTSCIEAKTVQACLSAKKTISNVDLGRIHDIQEILTKMNKHAVRHLVKTNQQLQTTVQHIAGEQIKKNPKDEIIDLAINSIGKDQELWKRLAEKHEGLRDFLSSWHQRKLDEKAGRIPKPPRNKWNNHIQADRRQHKKAQRRLRKKEESLMSSEAPKTQQSMPGRKDKEFSAGESQDWDKAQEIAREEAAYSSDDLRRMEVDKERMLEWVLDT